MREFNLHDLLFLLQSFQWTLVLSAMGIVLGSVLGLGVALLRLSANAAFRAVASGYIQLVQGIPLLGLLMFAYYGIPVFLGLNVPALVAVGAAFAFWAASYFGEIWRAGIQSIKRPQWEAAACLGISRWQRFRHVIAPQAMRLALPPTVGFIVQMIKGTSLAAVVGFVEITRAGQMISAATFQPLMIFSIVAAIYFCICFPLTMLSRKLENRLNGSG